MSPVRRPPAARLVSVTARTVQARDGILIGGQVRRVHRVERVHGGARLSLHTGERLIIGLRHAYTVTRPVAGPGGPDGDSAELSMFCAAALAGGERWATLHAHCRGPLILTLPDGASVLLPCGCRCHCGEGPEVVSA